MMSKFTVFYRILLILLMGCNAPGESGEQKLTVAAASNMRFVMEALTKEFKRKTNINIEVIIGSSGKLAAQIMQGAPFDIFLAANLKYPMNLHQQGYSVDQPKIFALGSIVLWTSKPEIKASIKSLTDTNIKHIALANPKNAPFGAATIEALHQLKIYENVKTRLVYGESISQTNQFIISGAADIGFTSKSVVVSPELKGKGAWVEVDPNIYAPIAHGLVIIKKKGRDTGIDSKARSFFDFMFSEEAIKILNEYGYQTGPLS